MNFVPALRLNAQKSRTMIPPEAQRSDMLGIYLEVLVLLVEDFSVEMDGNGSKLGRIAAKFEFSQASHRMQCLEGMRGVAALLVFFVHFRQAFGGGAGNGLLRYAATIGHAGVDLFFALSGFLVYGIVLKRTFAFWSYFGRRIQRLYPTFAAVFLIYILVSSTVPQVSKFSRTASFSALWLLENLAMLPGVFPIKPLITVAWSLSYEWLFYLLLPAVVAGLRLRQWTPRRRTWFFAGCVVLTVALCRSLNLSLNYDRFAMFLAGILVWEWIHQWQPGHRLPRWGEWLAMAGFAASLAWIGQGSSPNGPALRTYTPVLWLSSSALLVCTIHSGGILQRVFSWKPFRWTGNMSYSYYLSHGMIIRGIQIATGLPSRNHLSPWLLAGLWAGCEVAALAGSVGLYLLVEYPYSIGPRFRPAQPVVSQLGAAAGERYTERRYVR